MILSSQHIFFLEVNISFSSPDWNTSLEPSQGKLAFQDAEFKGKLALQDSEFKAHIMYMHDERNKK